MKISKHIQIAALSIAVLASLSLSAAAQNSSNTSSSASANRMAKQSWSKLTTSDRTFMKKAAEGGEAEVKLGKLAEQKAASSDVKQFGERMVTDHTKANDQLKDLASKEGVTLPGRPDAAQEAEYQRLSKLSGNQFDDAYMKLMVKDHTKDVSDFKMESKNATNPQVKQFASSTLPTLESHLHEAKSIAPKESARK